jgi:L-aminoadipate-semialdehyde dehydrogenase
MTAHPTPRTEAQKILRALGSEVALAEADGLHVHSPISGEEIARLAPTSAAQAAHAIGAAQAAFEQWRSVPAPRRGELVRLLGDELRSAKQELGRLVTLETGKILSEGQGEVQEMIDICDFAVGLSRQLYGLAVVSERAEHRLMEQWHPIGPVGVISAFNFPVAVWSWNAALALVCGNPVLWKPSERTPLTALAVEALLARAAAKLGDAPAGLHKALIGGRELGRQLVDDARVPVVSATGSTAMGRTVGERLARRFARAILELGGNNAAIVAPSADLALALRGIAFAAMGTAGQRCTSLRRLIVHDAVYDELVGRLVRAYGSVAIGDPRDPTTLVGPLIDGAAFDGMQEALQEAKALGATVHGGARVAVAAAPDAHYAQPALVEMAAQDGPVLRETFAPILYVMRYAKLEDAIAMHNGVPQGLASCIFTNDLREAERFISATGSDCGIANVNIGPSGAEIGGAFGGEKETGGGRESGSDAWKGYMRRTTNTINFGSSLPLAQGVRFEIDDA